MNRLGRQERQERQPRQRRQRGVALLAVLWVLAGAGTAVALCLGVVRDGIATSQYRSEYTRARWAAEGCLAEFRARLERGLDGATALAAAGTRDDPWTDPGPEIPPGCDLRVAPPTDGPIDVNAAPESVLLSLPGFDPEVVTAVLAARAWGRRLRDLDQLLGNLPADLRDRVATHYAELVGRAVFAPPAWVVTGHGVVAGRLVPIVSERWVLAGTRVAIVRRELQ
jgi:type II secretory pathway component PulK